MAFGSDHQWNWRNFFICFSISMGQLAFGYPASIIGTTLGQPSFLLYMKLITPEGLLTSDADQLIGAMSGVFQAGAFFGVLLGSWVMDKWGRKAGMVYCAILSLVGGTLLCAAQGSAMFIVFRFVAGAGSWGFLALTPVYTAELAPPKLRGFFVGMNGVNIALGYALASYMGMAFYFADNPVTQWRGPLGLALVFPVIMLIVIIFVPESPRWLLMVGRTEEAKKIVFDLHNIPGDEDQEYAKAEFYQMQKQTEFDRTLNPTWWGMFSRPSYRKRTILACAFAFIGQSTAVLVINNYGPTLYKALGYGTKDQLALQCGWITVAIPGNLIGACFMDRWGRKPLMLFGVIGCCACLIIEAAMVATYATPIPEHPNHAGLSMGVAAFYLFLAIYSLGIDVAGVVFYGELFPNHLRGKGLALSIATIALTDLVYLQATATAFAHIGWKFYLVFIIISGLGSIFVYYYVPETKGIPLEEIAALFGDSDEVMVFSEDIRVDHTTHELVVKDHGNPALTHVATGTNRRDTGDTEKQDETVVHVE